MSVNTDKPRKMRAYIIEIAETVANGLIEARGPQKFLVRASSAAAARRLVEPQVTARVASKDDLVEAIQLGLVLIDGSNQAVLGQQILSFDAGEGQPAALLNGQAESRVGSVDIPEF